MSKFHVPLSHMSLHLRLTVVYSCVEEEFNRVERVLWLVSEVCQVEWTGQSQHECCLLSLFYALRSQLDSRFEASTSTI